VKASDDKETAMKLNDLVEKLQRLLAQDQAQEREVVLRVDLLPALYHCRFEHLVTGVTDEGHQVVILGECLTSASLRPVHADDRERVRA
jgi:hypothetical protein